MPPPPLIVTVGADVYPVPSAVTEMALTTPLVTVAVADACVVPPPPVIDTVGTDVYPEPPLVTLIAYTRPDTLTVASADIPSYCHIQEPSCTKLAFV